MPILANARHEKFAQELAKGASQAEAYIAAGYTGDRTAASRLSTNVNVVARVAELQSEAAEETVCTIHDIARQLDEDRHFARELKAPGPAITATMGKAKVLGLISDKHEHTGKGGGAIQTEDVTDTEVVRWMLFNIAEAKKASAGTQH